MLNNYESRMPEYLHLPIQVMWFDANELTFLVMLYLSASLLGGWAWLLMLILPFPVLSYKRKQARGFFTHFLYKLGFLKFQFYPDSSANLFRE